MRNLFILLTILGLGASVFSADYDNNSRPVRQMQKSFEQQDRICKAVASNFRLDPKFAAYIRNLCNLYTVDRQRSISYLFPTENRQYEDGNSREQMAKYAIAKDIAQIQYYKQLAEQYCKYDEYKISKKDPQACDRLEEIFKSYNIEESED